MGIADLWAVECKDQVAKASRGDVQTFHNKVENIGASRGVMVARNGYQAGCLAAKDQVLRAARSGPDPLVKPAPSWEARPLRQVSFVLGAGSTHPNGHAMVTDAA